MANDGFVPVSNGKYWTAYGRDQHGALVRRGIGAKAVVSRAAALRACRDMTDEVATQRSPLTLGGFLDRYIDLRDGEIADTTLARHKLAAKRLKEHFGENRKPETITPADAQDFVKWLRDRLTPEGEKPSDFTVWGVASLCRDIMGRALDEGRIRANPFAKVKIKTPRRAEKPGYVKAEVVAKVIEKCPDAGWKAMFGLCRYAGLRAKEAMYLERTHVDLARRVVHIWPRGLRVTTKQAVRSIPVSPALYDVLEEALRAAPEGNPLVAWSVDRHNYLKVAHEIMVGAGHDWPDPFQTCRASIDTDWQSENLPAASVAAWLGHDLRVSAAHYFTVQPELLARVTGVNDQTQPTLRLVAG